MNLFLNGTKSSVNAANPTRVNHGSAFFRRASEADFCALKCMAEKIENVQWVSSCGETRLVRAPARINTARELAEEVGRREKAMQTLGVLQQVAVAVRNGKLEAALQELERKSDAACCLKNAERFAKLACGAIPRKKSEPYENYVLKFSDTLIASGISGMVFAATGSAIAGVVFALSLPPAVFYTTSAYRRSEFHLRRKFGLKKTSGYLFVDRLLRLPAQKLDEFAVEIGKLASRVGEGAGHF